MTAVGPFLGGWLVESASWRWTFIINLPFAAVEQRSDHPLVPIAIFKATQFTAANIVTLVVYAAISGAFFLLPIQLQTVVGFTPIASGATLLPITIIMLFGSSRAGRRASVLASRRASVRPSRASGSCS